jgi:hypothetical protein
VSVDNSEISADALTGLLHWLGFSLEQFVNHRAGQRIRKQAMLRLILSARARQPVDYTPLPRIPTGQITPQEFKSKYVIPNKAVVLEGFARHWPALRDWNFAFFRRELAAYKVPVRFGANRVNETTLGGRILSFAELIDRLENGEDVYAQNLQGIFHDYPKLRQSLGLDGVKQYLCRYRFSPITSTQLFLSNQKARTFYHCAPSVNLFTQICGAKKWFMVAPEHSMWMHITVRDDTFYLQSMIDWREPAARQQELGYGLYNCIPKYEALVEPGDAIFVPQWWWHAVENEGHSIGVSTHAFNSVFTGHKYMAILGLLNKPVWENVIDIVRHGSGTDRSLLSRVLTLGGASEKP